MARALFLAVIDPMDSQLDYLRAKNMIRAALQETSHEP